MSSPNAQTHSLSFPAPEALLWVCPECGPAASSRLEPSQIFRRHSSLHDREGGGGSSEWRKIECCGCKGKFMLRINSDGWVTALPIDTNAAPSKTKGGYSAVDP